MARAQGWGKFWTIMRLIAALGIGAAIVAQAIAEQPGRVEVLLRIRPDPEQIREAIAVFVGRMMPAADRQRVEQAMREVSYRMEMRYRLVTEPDTLRPWSFEERKDRDLYEGVDE